MGRLELMNQLMENKVELLKNLQRALEVERGYIQSLETDRIQDVLNEIESIKSRAQSVDLQFLSEFDTLKKETGVSSLDDLVSDSTRGLLDKLQVYVSQVKRMEENIQLSEQVNKELRLKRGRVLPNKNVRQQAANAYNRMKK